MADVSASAVDLLRNGEVQASLQAAQAACDRRPRDAEAWWLLGRVARHAGLINASDIAFDRAASLDPEKHPLPFRVSRERFTELVVENAPEGAHVHIEDLPYDDALREGVDPETLVREDPASARVLYQANFENRARDEEDLVTALKRTLGRKEA